MEAEARYGPMTDAREKWSCLSLFWRPLCTTFIYPELNTQATKRWQKFWAGKSIYFEMTDNTKSRWAGAAIYKSCIIIHAQILHNGNGSETTQPKSDSTFCIPYCSAISVLEIKNPRPWPFKRFPPPSVEPSSWQHDFQLYLFKQAHP